MLCLWLLLLCLFVDVVALFYFIFFSFSNRLTHIKENHKFQKNGKEGHRVEDPAMGLRHIVTQIKDQHALK